MKSYSILAEFTPQREIPVTGEAAASLIAALNVYNAFNLYAQVMLETAQEFYGVRVFQDAWITRYGQCMDGRSFIETTNPLTNQLIAAILKPGGQIWLEKGAAASSTSSKHTSLCFWPKSPDAEASIRTIAQRTLPLITPLLS